MAFFANYPVALASGMGLNAYFAYSVCIPLAEQGVTDPYKIALVAVLVEGIVFVLLSPVQFQRKAGKRCSCQPEVRYYRRYRALHYLYRSERRRYCYSGCFYFSKFRFFQFTAVYSCCCGADYRSALYHFNVKGYILIGILATWILGMGAEAVGWYQVDPEAGIYSLFPNFDGASFIPLCSDHVRV